jgi:hypothetical protein
MAYKLIGFAYAGSDNSSYINIQLQAIKNAIPSLETELGDENDSRIQTSPIPKNKTSYLPLYIVQDGSGNYVGHRTGKFPDKEVLSWLRSSFLSIDG